MMKKTGVFFAAFYFAALGCLTPVKSQERMMVDEVVAVVGNSMILYSDVVSLMGDMAEQQRLYNFTSSRDPQCEAIEMLLMQKLLANQARIDSLEGNPSFVEQRVEADMDQLLDKYGSMHALEAAYYRPVYQVRDDLREKYNDMMLAQSMEYSVKGDVLIVPSEVERYYKKTDKDSLPMVAEQYIYAQIVMYPPSLKDAKLRARERLLEYRERIASGGAKFDMLARAYSQDPGSAMRGGEYDFTVKDPFHRPFAGALSRLRPGQISPVVETDDGFHIIELLEKKGELYRFRHILIKPSYTADELMTTANRLDSVGDLVRGGSITFEEAALKYSQDDYSKYNGGEVTNRQYVELSGDGSARNTSNRFTREALGYMGNDYTALRLLKPGEVSASYQTLDLRGNQQVKIVILKEVIPTHRANLRDDYTLIEDRALEEKETRVFEEWLKKKMAAMYIRIEPKYQNCDFENKGWIK